jgi:hypothetical protein
MATVSVIYDEETDDYIVPLGNDVCDELGWQVGDTIKWQDNGDGSYTLTKVTKNDKDWNREKIEQELWKIKFACTDPRMDGFTTWGCKKDLIVLKYYIDEMLEQCPTYSVEQEFVDKLEQQKTFNLLKKKHK